MQLINADQEMTCFHGKYWEIFKAIFLQENCVFVVSFIIGEDKQESFHLTRADHFNQKGLTLFFFSKDSTQIKILLLSLCSMDMIWASKKWNGIASAIP